jgi:hypothetical protein
LNEPAAPILHNVPTGATYGEATEGLENCYGDHHLEAAFHSQLKRKTQLIRETLQEFAIAIDYLAHHAHVKLSEHLISKESDRYL